MLIGMDVESALTDAGFTVALVHSCDKAEKFLTDKRPDVAVLDIRLRDGDCVATAKMLVKQGVPFVVHTGLPLCDIESIFRSGTILRRYRSTTARPLSN